MCKTTGGKVKFSLLDMITSSGSGQTSATGTIGVILCLLSIIMIATLFIYYFINIDDVKNIMDFFDKAMIILGIGSALLGTRKISGAFGSKKINGSNIIDTVENTLDSQNSNN